MPNPTPQQRIEELARELEDGHRTYPDGTPRYEFMEKIRQALKQAYVAGLEAVAESVGKLGVCARGRECPDWHGMCPNNLLSNISQLKEQINK